ncbi:MAG: zinc-dependent metalloprotease [bacterium]|nr:zinc-dependent metalloprotease [bacterium]
MFHRVGPKVLFVQPNYRFRAISENPEERRAVRESFAQSVIWGFEVAAEEEGLVLVDASAFFLRDQQDLTGALRWANQGRYEIDVSRSAFYLPRTKNFPKNTEVEVTVTVVGDDPGDLVWQVVPDPGAITVRQHHSFIELPDAEYKPRIWDPRSGLFTSEDMDFAAPIGEPVVKRFVARHRLQKRNPNVPVSEPAKPIVYYVDSAAPEPIRSALLEGASWWNEAFEAAGYLNAFRVEILPEGADPMDVRYNVIQWVHRSTGGRSPASSVRDPRTGEIIKGHVTIASLRVREHYLLAEALLAPYEQGKPVSPDLQRLALARMRQLAAHEVGHTLGLRHNFAASVDDRASVMDYPLPLVKVTQDGSFDLSDAYTTGVGEWDKAAIAYAYQEFKGRAEEERGLSDVLSKATASGLHYLSDPHARAAGGAHPLGHPYDNGSNPVDELVRVMKVRALALGRVSENNLREGAPMARLEEVLLLLYMFHRYQVEAVSKLLGGLYYTYAVRGDGQNVTERVSPEEQRRALDALLGTIQPDVLAIPESILDLIPPLPPGVSSPNRPREVFERRTGFTFDPLSAAEATAHMTVRLMLHPARAARLVEYHARDDSYPGLAEVLDKLIQSTWKSGHGSGYHAEIGRVVDTVIVYNMMSLCTNENAATQVRAVALLKLEELKNWLRERLDTTENVSQRAHFRFAILQIERFLQDPAEVTYTKPIEPPPGEDWKLPWLAW